MKLWKKKKKVGWESRELWCGWCLAICLVSFPKFRLNPGLRPWRLMCSSAIPQELNPSLLLVRGSVSSIWSAGLQVLFKTIALTRQTFVGKVMSLLWNMLSRLAITFLPRSKCLLISWLQAPSVLNSCFISSCGSLIHNGYCLPDSSSSSSQVGHGLMTSCWKSLMTTIWPAYHCLNRNSHLQSVSIAQQNCP